MTEELVIPRYLFVLAGSMRIEVTGPVSDTGDRETRGLVLAH